jgi:iron complex transport system ATP-binding protein
MILECRQLGWSTGGQSIVREIDLQVREGETFGLIGPNGSGKSTLMRLLAGVLAPSTGEVQLHGRPLSGLRRRAIAQAMALVEQQAETADRISVRDAVELGRTPWLSALRPWSAEDDAIVLRALTVVEMADRAARDWITLSGGERQRVHIARALAQQPQILLLDEPTNHLDIHHQLGILQLVAGLGVTTVIALHDLNQAMSCDRLGVMHQGHLVATGTPDEMLTTSRLRDVFGVRASFLTDPADGSRVIRFHPLS